jgi:hyperosmotically inducible periplasmic protein
MKRKILLFSAPLALIVGLSLGCSSATTEPGESRESRTFSTTVHDGFTTASVKMSLAFEPGVRAMDVHVDTNRGKVTLTGEVRSEAERQLAVKVTEDVSGVKEVVDRIEVHG